MPAGGSACDSESTPPTVPGPTLAANATGDAQVFTPAANKVVILASCWDCGRGGITDRTFRWISTNNGVDFSAPVEIGSNLVLNGQAAYIDSRSTCRSATEGVEFQATDPPLRPRHR